MSTASIIAPLRRLGTRAAPRRRLICIPFAGGGVSAFRTWHRLLPDDVEVLAAQLPGRELRIREAPLRSVREMAAALLPEIEAASDLPYALFGHSMGALVAYELASALESRAGRPPSALFVSARRAPDEPDPRAPLHTLPDDAFLTELQRRYGAIPAAVLDEPELLELLLPVVRADIQAVETYRASPSAERIRCPVHVYGGDADRHPHPEQLSAWDRATVDAVRVRVFSGDHFYLNSQSQALTADIAAQWSVRATSEEGA